MGRIIGLAGKAQSGKGAVARILVEHHEFEEIAFADPLKKAVGEVFGFGHEELYGDKKYVEDPFWQKSPGRILQIVGTDLFRDHFDQDIWVKSLLRRILTHPEKSYVVSDCRFENEVTALQKTGGLIVLVRSRTREKKKDARDLSHPSETALDAWTGWDAILDNDGTLEDLQLKVETLLFA